ncbi:MAG: hypothetical protein V4577_25895 [Bacteroidota bacterium]
MDGLIEKVREKIANFYQLMAAQLTTEPSKGKYAAIDARLKAAGKWFFVRVLNLFAEIVPYFTKRSYLMSSQQLNAVSIKVSADSYSATTLINPAETNGLVVSGVFDTAAGNFLDEEDILILEYGTIDEDTNLQFGNNDLLIIT